MTRKNFYKIDEFEAIASHLRFIPAKKILARPTFEVREAFTIEDKVNNQFSFPQYFSSDGGTIPWWARPMFPSAGRFLGAYLCHDTECDRATRSGLYKYREDADKLFYYHLRQCGAAKWRAKIMSFAVKRYGEMLKAKGELK